MNTSTQPAEGAGGSRSRAAGELTLGLLSGEELRVYAALPLLFCGSWLASDGGLSVDSILTGERTPRPGRPVGRLAFAFAFDLLAPSRGFVPVLRSGQPGMDAGLAAAGHGWPMAAGSVGASLLAKNLRAPRGVRLPASSLTSIASKLAPTGFSK
jgi:hypothetical protein